MYSARVGAKRRLVPICLSSVARTCVITCHIALTYLNISLFVAQIRDVTEIECCFESALFKVAYIVDNGAKDPTETGED